MRPPRPDGIELTFWAEEHATEPELLELLEHSDAVIREGAVYGLMRVGITERTRSRLAFAALTDQSLGVRQAAQDALDP